MAKIEKIGNTQVIDNKEDNFFYFPMISMACTGCWDTSRFKLLVRDIETGTPVVELGTVIAFIRAKILYR